MYISTPIMNAINDGQCLARDFSFLKRVSKFRSLVPSAKKYPVKHPLEGCKIFPEMFFNHSKNVGLNYVSTK